MPLAADLRYAFRLLRKSPVFTLVAIATLALGIGANTVMFSVVDRVLIRPLPYPEADRVAMIWEATPSYPKNTPAPANYFDWRDMTQSFAEVAATRGAVANLTGDGQPEEVRGRLATPNFFTVLGVPPLLGRTFSDAENRDGANVAVISYTLWHRRYGGDASVVGRGILMNNQTYTVIGVMPQPFAFRDREIDYWVPVRFTPQQASARTSHNLNVVGRLKAGVSVEAAQAEMTSIARALEAKYPDSNLGVGAVVVPIREEVLGNADLQLIVLMMGAVAVLLIACANLASLLLSRAMGRRGELAVRAALGASRGRLVQQMLVEGLLLSLTGGVLGIALAHFGGRVVSNLTPVGLARSAASAAGPALEFDVRVLAFTFAVAVATGLLFSLVPALQAVGGFGRSQSRGSVRLQADPSLSSYLSQRHAINPGSRLTRDALVVVQIALAVVLLAATGLMVRTILNLQRIDVGFRPEGLLTMRVSLPYPKYIEHRDRVSFFERVVSGVEALPGVERAAYGFSIPFTSQGNSSSFGIEGRTFPRETVTESLMRAGTPGYLATLGVTLLDGRLLDERDGADAPRAVVINETFKRQFFADESPLGHRLNFSDEARPYHTIVGVVKDVSERGYQADRKPAAYLSIAQAPDTWAIPEYLVIRAAGVEAASLADGARGVVAAVNPDQPISSVRTMEDIFALAIADRHQQMTLLGAFAGLALVLATIGLYGLLAYLVSQRRKEIGLRIALGATRGSVVALVAGRGLALAAIGLGFGVAVGAAATRWLSSSLYGIGANDPSTFALVIALLGAVALIASIVPALRAAGLDPMGVLRED